MALLTNEQVTTLIEKICKRQELLTFNQGLTFKRIRSVIDDWNEEQFFHLGFISNWKNSPTGAVKAALSICWYDEKGNLILRDLIEEFPKPVTPHPHAEMIMKYAEVAQRRVDPWVEFEWYHIDEWRPLTSWPTWGINAQYRHIGETK
jgi:hypothetical protein